MNKPLQSVPRRPLGTWGTTFLALQILVVWPFMSIVAFCLLLALTLALAQGLDEGQLVAETLITRNVGALLLLGAILGALITVMIRRGVRG